MERKKKAAEQAAAEQEAAEQAAAVQAAAEQAAEKKRIKQAKKKTKMLQLKEQLAALPDAPSPQLDPLPQVAGPAEALNATPAGGGQQAALQQQLQQLQQQMQQLQQQQQPQQLQQPSQLLQQPQQSMQLALPQNQAGHGPWQQHPIGMPLANPSNSMLFQMQGAQMQHQTTADLLADQEKLEQAALQQKYALQRTQHRIKEAFTAGQQMDLQHMSQPQPVGHPLMQPQLQPQLQLQQQQLLPQLLPSQNTVQGQPLQPQLSQQQLLQLLLQQQMPPQ